MVGDIATVPAISQGRERISLLGLVATLAAGALMLRRLAGPPHLPAALPSVAQIELALASPAVPYDAFTYVLTTAAWIVWLWLVGSLLLRLVVVLAESAARGAAWVRSLRTLSDHLTLPVVRRLVDGAVATVTVVQLVSRTTPLAAAASLPARPAAIVAQAAPQPTSAPAASTVTYLVRPGDTLWSIAERFYGDGDAFPRIVAANAGRPMPGGEVFTRAGVIRDGWMLLIPGPTRVADSVERLSPTVYTVQDGDTLRSIAQRFYGDEMRWPAIYRANQGVLAPNGLALTNPDRIWAGMRLVIPGVAPGIASSPTSPPASHPSVVAPPAGVGARPAPAAPVPPARPHVPAATATPVAVVTPATISSSTVAVTAPAPTAPAADRDAPSVDITPAPVAAQAPTARVTPGTPPSDLAEQHRHLPGGELLILGFGGVAVVGAASLLARRRRRHCPDEPPLPDEDPLPIEGGFATAAAARVVAAGAAAEDVEPAVLVATQTLRFLREREVRDAGLVHMRQGRRSAVLTLACQAEDRGRLLDLAPDLGRRLGGAGRATATPDGDVALSLGGLDALGRLLPSVDPGSSPTLVPLGALPNHQLLYAPWDALGHVLIAGEPGGGGDVVLTSLLGALVSRLSPQDLQLHLVVARHALPEPLLHLPHLAGPVVDPADADAVGALVGSLSDELQRRLAGESAADAAACGRRPDLVVVLDDLATVAEQGEALDALLLHGPAFGIRLLVVTTRPMAIDDATLRHLETRLVLRLAREDESVLLLGHPDAADLGSGGAMLAQIAGREPVRLRAFRIADDHVAYLLRSVEQESMALPPAPAAATPPAPAPATPAATEAASALSATSPAAPDHDDHSASQPVSAEVDAPGPSAENGQANGKADEAPEGPELDSSGAAAVALPEQGSEPSAILEGGEVTEAEESPADDEGDEPAPPDAGTGPEIRIECFGTFRVLCDGRELRPEALGYNVYRPWEVLAYLAVQPPGPVTRRQLVDDIWGDRDEADPERLQARVRTVLTRIRKLFEQQVPGLRGLVVFLDREGKCWLNTQLVQSEAHEFLELVRSSATLPPEEAVEACRRARELFRGDVLADCQYEWLFSPAGRNGSLQQAYRQKYRTVTARLAHLNAEHGQAEQAAILYRELLGDDAGNEKLAGRLFACHVQAGDVGALRRDFRWLEGVHREQYQSPLGPRALAAYEASLRTLADGAVHPPIASTAPSAS